MRRNNRVFRGGQVARPKRRDQPAADAEGEYSFPGVVRALSGAALGVAGDVYKSQVDFLCLLQCVSGNKIIPGPPALQAFSAGANFFAPRAPRTL